MEAHPQPTGSPSLPIANLGPRMPQELCDMILTELPPKDAWRLRRVSKTWDAYVLTTLAPKVWLPAVSVCVRGPQSWIFWDDSSATRFVFKRRSEDGGAVVYFEPKGSPLGLVKRRSLLVKMEEEVEIVWTFPPGETLKNLKTLSLSLIDRRKLVLGVSWRELFVKVFAAGCKGPASPRQLGDDRPTLLWTANGEDGEPGVWTAISSSDESETDDEAQALGDVEEQASNDSLRPGGSSGYEADIEDVRTIRAKRRMVLVGAVY